MTKEKTKVYYYSHILFELFSMHHISPAACQIKCGDIFENDVVGVFNSCAVSQKKCVPQKQNNGEYPIPLQSSMVKSFDTSIWNGRY